MSRIVARSLLATLLCAALVAAVAVAHTPPDPGARFEVHDHSTPGKKWHVEFEVAKSGDALKNFVVYSQECDETTFTETVPLNDFSDFEITGENFGVGGHFVDAARVEGVWRITKEGCDTGPRDFVAKPVSSSHSHGHAGHKGRVIGHALGTMPDLSDATPDQLRRTKRYWRATLRAAARKPFTSYFGARTAGFVRYPRKWQRPLVFHLRKTIYERDARELDPRRPESLVYWWPRQGRPILVGFMYRVPAPGKPPGGPLFAWHRHFENNHLGTSQMTHIWLTGDVRSALANCLPVKQLEAYLPDFRYEKPRNGSSHESVPCADDA